MSAIRMLSAKLLEPTTTLLPLPLSFESGLSDLLSEDEEHPASSAAVAASATAAAPGSLLLDVLVFAVEVTIPVPGSGGGAGCCTDVRGAGHHASLIQSRSFLVGQEHSGHRLASMCGRLQRPVVQK